MSSQWGVRVNEVGIFATGLGAEWWAQALAPWEVSGRAVCLGLTSAELPGVLEAAGTARAVVLRALAGHPAADDAVLCVDELAANAVLHSSSGLPGGTFTVTVALAGAGVRIAVTDAGATDTPRVMRPSRGRTHGRGLALVDALAASWGWGCEHRGGPRTTWCEICPATTSQATERATA
jgi:anti-sigma regulatory factor (Ser/Thr protein kinase)